MSKRKSGAKPKTNKGPWKHRVKEERRKVAEARNAEYNKLTIEQKLAMLNKYNFVAAKQRAKLQAKLKVNK